MSLVHSPYDVAVVGASLSGCAAAVTLARGGARVAIFEKEHLFREKPCGEGLSASGIVAAKRLGFWSEEEPPVTFRPYDRFIFRVGQLERVLPLRRGGISIERRLFDAHVMSVAANATGVDVFFGSPARASIDEEGIRVASERLGIRARFLIVADGGRSPLARSLGVREIRTGFSRVGAACHYRGRFRGEPRVVHIEIEREYELYATPLADGRLNVAVLAPLRSTVNPRDLLLDRERLRGVFECLRFEGEREGEVIGRAPIGGAERSGAPAGIFLAGDAAEEFDPIGGIGMTHALLSGELAGHVILEAMAGGAHLRLELTRRYECRRASLARPFRRFTALTYRTLRSSARWPFVLRVATSRLGERVTGRLVP